MIFMAGHRESMKTEIHDGTTFLIGTSATDNFHALDAAEPHHLWFHVANHSSCHVIAMNEPTARKKALRRVITRGALLCKQHSRYKSVPNLEILFARVRDVSKTAVPGTVLTSRASIIRV